MDKKAILKLFRQYKRTGPGSSQENDLVIQFEDMAFSMAKKVPYVDPEEAKSEALLAVLNAIRHFNPKRRIDPSTYVYTAIFNAMRSLRSKCCREETVSIKAVMPFAVQPKYEPSVVPDTIVALIQRNGAALPPHLIRLLRAIYAAESPSTMEELAKEAKVSVQSMRKKIKDALIRLRDYK